MIAKKLKEQVSISREVELAAGQNVKEYRYWLEKLAGEPVKSCFPFDYKEAGDGETVRSIKRFRIADDLFAGLNKLSKGSPHALHIVLLTGLTALLSKYTGSHDILTGAPIYRQETEAELINTMLAIRTRLHPGMTFKELLTRMKQTVLEAVDHQSYPVELLPDKLGMPVSATGTGNDFPLFDVVLLVREIHDRSYLKTLRPNMIFSFGTKEDHIEGEVEFDSSAYSEATVENLLDHFTRLLQNALIEPGVRLCDIEILSEEEKKRLLFDFNDTAADYPRDKTLPQLFEERVKKVPDNIALVHEDRQVTYGELNKKAGRTAFDLIEKGVETSDIVAIMMGRSIEMVVGLWGILKAGAAYLPIDPAYPQERIDYMLKDSGARLLLKPTPPLRGPSTEERSVWSRTPKSTTLICGGFPSGEGTFQPVSAVETQHLASQPLEKQKGVGAGDRTACFNEGHSSGIPSNGGVPEGRGGLGARAACPGSSSPRVLSYSEVFSCDGNRLVTSEGARAACYVIYTSGTTGKPKGVLVEHRGVVNFTYWRIRELAFDSGDITLQSFSFTFDGFGCGFYPPLLSGGVLLLAPVSKQSDFFYIKKLIKAAGVSDTTMAPAMYDALLECVEGDELSSLKWVTLAGDKANINLLNKSRKKYPDLPIYNEYGPTENSVGATFCRNYRENGNTGIIGKPNDNVRLYILDPSGNPTPIGIPGELAIGGDGVARGYLNRPELTHEKFVSDGPAGGPTRVGGHKIYRSGDLAKWLDGGNIEFVGRIDQQVKIRGFRIELGEIEDALQRYSGIEEAVVIDWEQEPGTKSLSAYIVSKGEIDTGAVRDYLAKELPSYMLPAYMTWIEKIPLTPNGKLDRKALPEPGLDRSGVAHIAPRDEAEEKIAMVYGEVLGIEKDEIGIDDHFFALGGHSLKAAVAMARLRKEFGAKAALEEIFKTPTIRELAKYFKAAGAGHEYSSIEAAEKKESYPLSSAQKRLYILQELYRDNVVYNLPAFYILKGKCDRDRLEETFTKLIARHESLRTFFEMQAGEPVQRIHDTENIDFKIEYYETGIRAQGSGSSVGAGLAPARDSSIAIGQPQGLPLPSTGDSSGPVTQIIDSLIRAFDLSQAPLFRVGMIEIAEEEGSSGDTHLLLFDMHHIISDGVSNGLFAKEFMALYAGVELAPLRLHYKDYSQWQHSEAVKASIKEQEAYWLEQFSGEIPVLYLPTDFPRPAVQSFAGSTAAFEIDSVETAALKQIAKDQGGTLYMIVLTILNILLSKISGQEDIVIGTGIAGRTHTDLERIIGMFVNTLPLRSLPAGEKTFSEFAAEVKETALKSFENQEYQFEDLIDNVDVKRDAGRNPLFDVMFVLQNLDLEYEDIPEIEMTGLSLKPYEYESKLTKFDLDISCAEAGEKLYFTLAYCTELFKEETIERFIAYTSRIVSAVTREPGLKLHEIEILSEEEREVLLYEFNDTGSEYPRDKTLHELFMEQVERTPDGIALTGYRANDKGVSSKALDMRLSLTYGELNKESNVLASQLIAKGVLPETIVGIMTDRSIEAAAGILAILKSGGAYLPVNPEYPYGRVAYMLADSSAAFLLTARAVVKDGDKLKRSIGEAGSNPRFEIIYTDQIEPGEDRGHECRFPGVPEGLAYVIYTSGTTGKPKGVLIRHRGVVNVITCYGRRYKIAPGFKIMQMSDYTFDASVDQLFGALLHGAELHIIRRTLLLNIDKLRQYIRVNKVNLVDAVPLLLKELLCREEKLDSVRVVISGGERLDEETKAEALKRGYSLYNHYGPTETTVDALISRCSQGRVNLGKPIANYSCFIFDKNGGLLPMGAPGELVIAGVGVARGYLNNPELTHEKFIKAEFRIQNSESGIAPARDLSLDGGQPLLMAPRAAGFVKDQEQEGILYKTGDLARWLPDANIEFLGRIDQQVKIRGFRIELGEIESYLLRYDGIKEAVVIDWEKQPGQKVLCAYVVPSGEIDPAVVRDYLAKELPDYMVPAYMTLLEKIPLTGNGKCDRKKLPPPRLNIDNEYAAPRDENERLIAAAWKEVLGLDKVGIHHNFFDLGGSSIDFMKLNSKLKDQLNKDIPLTMMFRYPTVATFCRYLSEEDFSLIIDRSAEKKQGTNRLQKMRSMKKRRVTK